jgi:hypothetical protein
MEKSRIAYPSSWWPEAEMVSPHPRPTEPKPEVFVFFSQGPQGIRVREEFSTRAQDLLHPLVTPATCLNTCCLNVSHWLVGTGM